MNLLATTCNSLSTVVKWLGWLAFTCVLGVIAIEIAGILTGKPVGADVAVLAGLGGTAITALASSVSAPSPQHAPTDTPVPDGTPENPVHAKIDNKVSQPVPTAPQNTAPGEGLGAGAVGESADVGGSEDGDGQVVSEPGKSNE